MPSLIDPQRLYELAERQHWQAHSIDLRRDRLDWMELSPEHRRRLIWHIASFLVGEDRVMVELAPLLAARETASEAAFLVTQQADEVRHAQHLHRFYKEVVGVEGTWHEHLTEARGVLGSSLIALLDDRLSGVSHLLAANPCDGIAKVDFVIVYHMVIEGMLAMTGQRMLLEFLERRRILPGCCCGLHMIARDERRHVAYGTWLLRQKASSPMFRERMVEQLGELIPMAVAALVPPGARPKWFRPLDWDGVRVHAFALDGLSRRLKVVGVELPETESPMPI